MKDKKQLKTLIVCVIVLAITIQHTNAKFSFNELFGNLRKIDFNYSNVAGFTPLTIPSFVFGRD